MRSRTSDCEPHDQPAAMSDNTDRLELVTEKFKASVAAFKEEIDVVDEVLKDIAKTAKKDKKSHTAKNNRCIALWTGKNVPKPVATDFARMCSHFVYVCILNFLASLCWVLCGMRKGRHRQIYTRETCKSG